MLTTCHLYFTIFCPRYMKWTILKRWTTSYLIFISWFAIMNIVHLSEWGVKDNSHHCNQHINIYFLVTHNIYVYNKYLRLELLYLIIVCTNLLIMSMCLAICSTLRLTNYLKSLAMSLVLIVLHNISVSVHFFTYS